MLIPHRSADHSHYLRVISETDPDDINPPPAHLGGGRRRCHMDPGALAWVVDTFGVESMLDVGCGIGGMVEYAREQGLEAMGVDGDSFCQPDYVWDFSRGPQPDPGPFDLVWSMEFVEHVDEQHLPNFMETFRRAPVVAMTFAPPGKKGRHHVNCREQPYWIDMFREHGFESDEEATNGFRAASQMRSVEHSGLVNHRKRKRFVIDYGLIFIRC